MKKQLLSIHSGLALFVAVTAISCNSEDSEPILTPPPTAQGFLELNGGGANFTNMVFVNLSAESQEITARESWDLGFFTGSDFEVKINGTTGALAYPTGETSFDEVGQELANSLSAAGTLDLSFNNMESALYTDNPHNILEGTILEVGAGEADAEIFILNRGESGATQRPWKKIKIFRNGDSYVLQHADIEATEFATVTFTKDNDYNFVYFSFENGQVEVEPNKQEWDIMWSSGTNIIDFPQGVNGKLAYFYQDLVYHNIHAGVSAVEVLESDASYEDFDAAQLGGYTLNDSDQLTIGFNWRGGGGPNSDTVVREDRFYLIKDVEGNIYKLRFLSLTKDGERGRPSLEYELVTSGN